MAIDNTPPRLRLIVTIAVIVVITLVGLDFVFKSYYAFMSDEAVREKLAPLKDREELHAAEKASLTSAKMPLDQAMAELAKGNRAELIEPKPSEDLGPMTGWSKLPKAVPQPIHGAGAGLEIATADAGAAAGDGGLATATGDGGAATDGGAHGGDAGAPHAAPGAPAPGAPHAPAPGAPAPGAPAPGHH